MTTPNLQFYGLSALPTTLEADAFYFIENGNYVESYITNSEGIARQIGNSLMINTLVAAALANWSGASSQIIIVPDILARDTLATTAETNLMVLVVDATGDATVGSGSALYAYDFTATIWYKLSEYESMDVVVQWGHIQGGPASDPAAIDTAVSQAHSHSNKAVLDKLTESAGGDLLYDGEGLKTLWVSKDW